MVGLWPGHPISGRTGALESSLIGLLDWIRRAHACPNQTVPYGTVFWVALSQALRARLRSHRPLQEKGHSPSAYGPVETLG
jgi:hypothetical protein